MGAGIVLLIDASLAWQDNLSPNRPKNLKLE